MATVYESVYEIAAEAAGRMPIMFRTADRILLGAKRAAARHRLTGNYLSKLEVEEVGNGKDLLVVAGDEAAYIIEFGYIRKKATGSRRVSARVIPGLHIMRSAYDSVARIA